MLKSLSSLIRKLFPKTDVVRDEPVEDVDTSPPKRDVALEQRVSRSVMLCLKSNDDMIIVLGAEPMSYTFGMLIQHTHFLCRIVKNMALWLSRAYPTDKIMLEQVANHGDGEPTDQPFAPMFGDDKPNKNTIFSATLTNFEVAQMAMIVSETYNQLLQSGMTAKEFDMIYNFWQEIWEKLPDAIKMSVAYSEEKDSLVN